MTHKEVQKQRTRMNILASASRLVRERGIGGSRVADVMQGAGLTVGGFYAHFASKEQLIDATLRRTASELCTKLFADLDAKPPAERALVVLKRYLSAAHRDDTSQGCPMPAVVAEIASGREPHGAALAEQVETLASRLQDLVPAHAPLSRRQLALALVALMYGGLTLARALRGTSLSDDMLRACRALGAMAAQSTKSGKMPKATEPP